MLADLLGFVQAVTALLPLLFVGAYTWTTPSWHRSPEGRYLVVSYSTFAAILLLAVLTRFGLLAGLGVVGRQLLSLGVYLLLAGVFTGQIVLFATRRRQRLRTLPERRI